MQAQQRGQAAVDTSDPVHPEILRGLYLCFSWFFLLYFFFSCNQHLVLFYISFQCIP